MHGKTPWKMGEEGRHHLRVEDQAGGRGKSLLRAAGSAWFLGLAGRTFALPALLHLLFLLFLHLLFLLHLLLLLLLLHGPFAGCQVKMHFPGCALPKLIIPLQAIKRKTFLLNQPYLNMEMIFNYSESISFYHRNVFERGLLYLQGV